jgi:cell division protein FtsI/penicillin-binding protein 2
VTGYNHPIYGQSGLEASLDEYLRGLRGNPAVTIWWNHLLYGMSPEGLDVRLSIDQSLQAHADELMKDRSGAVILLNAQSGELLVMSSHPTFDPGRLDEIGAGLNKDPDKPLINRAAQGLYPTGTMLHPFQEILFGDKRLAQDELQQVYEPQQPSATMAASRRRASPQLSIHRTTAGWFSQLWEIPPRRSPLRQRMRRLLRW